MDSKSGYIHQGLHHNPDKRKVCPNWPLHCLVCIGSSDLFAIPGWLVWWAIQNSTPTTTSINVDSSRTSRTQTLKPPLGMLASRKLKFYPQMDRCDEHVVSTFNLNFIPSELFLLNGLYDLSNVNMLHHHYFRSIIGLILNCWVQVMCILRDVIRFLPFYVFRSLGRCVW